MSNLSDTNNASHNTSHNASDTAIATDSNICVTVDLKLSRATKSNRWSFIQKDLSKAMNTWQELEKAEIGLSPEEEQLVKIKTIIRQLKQKLEQF